MSCREAATCADCVADAWWPRRIDAVADAAVAGGGVCSEQNTSDHLRISRLLDQKHKVAVAIVPDHAEIVSLCSLLIPYL